MRKFPYIKPTQNPDGSYNLILGDKTHVTTNWKPLPDDLYHSIVKQLTTPPTLGDVINQMSALVSLKTTNVGTIERYYTRPLQDQTKYYKSIYTVEETIHNRALLEHFYYKATETKMMDDAEVLHGIESSLALGSHLCKKVGSFPIKAIDFVLGKYLKENDNYYDPSCGWGARLMGAMRNRVNYFGTDPNPDLVPQLQKMSDDFHTYLPGYFTKFSTDIRCSGSEFHHTDWDNKMDLCFTSPPYFGTEVYAFGGNTQGQSHLNTTFQDWCTNYYIPTLTNCYRYLKPGGILAINIKDFLDNPLEQTTIDIATSLGFTHIDTLNVVNYTSVYTDKRSDYLGKRSSIDEKGRIKVDKTEPTFVFRKPI